MKLIDRIFRLGVCIAAAVFASAMGMASQTANFPFTYNVADEEFFGYGYGRTDAYDVCIHIHDESLSGAKVKSLSVPLPSGGEIAEEASAWIVTELTDAEITASNSLAFTSLTLSESDGVRMLSAEFADPAQLTPDGFYVGYTVKVESVENYTRKFPVAAVNGTTTGSMFLRTTTHKSWDRTFARLGYMSPMVVTLDRPMPSDAAQFSLPARYIAVMGEQTEIQLPVVNQGIEAISEIDYTYTYHAGTFSGSANFEPAIPAVYGATKDISLVVEGNSVAGNSPLQLTITKVNGKDNGASAPTSNGVLRSLPSLPVNRPVMEEYSGLWCGQCPSGWVALEQGRDLYGSDFVALSYHIDDDMQARIQTPQSAKAVPAIYLNRGGQVSADMTTSLWKEYSEEYTDCSLSIALNWTDESRSVLNAEVTATFMEPHPAAGYKIAMALVSDGLYNASWGQTNYLAGAIRDGKYWDIFTEGGAKVYGLTFNDIVCLFPYPLGEAGSLPANLEEFEPYKYNIEFNLSEAKSSTGYNLAADKSKLRAIAIVLDSNGRAVNSISSASSSSAPVGSGVDEVISDAEIVETIYYGLDGVALSSPAPGQPAIRVDRLADGSVRTSKVMSK